MTIKVIELPKRRQQLLKKNKHKIAALNKYLKKSSSCCSCMYDYSEVGIGCRCVIGAMLTVKELTLIKKTGNNEGSVDDIVEESIDQLPSFFLEFDKEAFLGDGSLRKLQRLHDLVVPLDFVDPSYVYFVDILEQLIETGKAEIEV